MRQSLNTRADERAALVTAPPVRVGLLAVSLVRIILVTTLLTVGPSGSPPVNVVQPSVSGVVRVTQVLTCDPGMWTGLPVPTLTFQWRRDGVAIIGATLSTYTVVAADLAAIIDCVVTGDNGVGSPVDAVSSNTLASPWQPSLATHPNLVIFDGLDPICYGGAEVGEPITSLYSIHGVLIGTQTITASKATRLDDSAHFDGSDDRYFCTPAMAGLFNDLTTYAVHCYGLSGLVRRHFYEVRNPDNGFIRVARVAAVTSTTRNDHRTSATQTILGGPNYGAQDIVIRWEPANSALYDLISGVDVFATVTGNPTVASFDSMILGGIAALTGGWTGKLRCFAVDSTAWTVDEITVWRACAVAAGAM